MRVPYTEHGLVTTPMLHYLLANHKAGATVETYIEQICGAYNEFMSLSTTMPKRYDRRMLVDCSNGVASIHMPAIVEKVSNYFQIDLINTNLEDPEQLGKDCGAHFV